VLGFKEIRYNYEQHIHFIKTVFSCSRIIFNNRLDAEAQRESAFFKKYAEVAELRAKNKESERLGLLYPQTSYLLPLEDLTAKGFSDLVRWLGFSDCSGTFATPTRRATQRSPAT